MISRRAVKRTAVEHQGITRIHLAAYYLTLAVGRHLVEVEDFGPTGDELVVVIFRIEMRCAVDGVEIVRAAHESKRGLERDPVERRPAVGNLGAVERVVGNVMMPGCSALLTARVLDDQEVIVEKELVCREQRSIKIGRVGIENERLQRVGVLPHQCVIEEKPIIGRVSLDVIAVDARPREHLRDTRLDGVEPVFGEGVAQADHAVVGKGFARGIAHFSWRL